MRQANGKPSGTRPVVCGIQPQTEPGALVPVAERLAERLGAPLMLVHAAPPPDVPERPFATLTERLEQQAAFERAGHLKLVLEPVEVDVRVEVERSVEFGHPPEALPAVAEQRGAELIVVGSAGRKALGRLLLGSTSSAWRNRRRARSPSCRHARP